MMKEEKLKKPCLYCGSERTIKYGKQNGVQKYKCKNEKCGKYFLERKKRTRYNSNEKKFLSLLWNFLKAKGDKRINIEEAITGLDVNIPNISEFQLVQREQSDNNVIYCYNPRLLICADDNKDIVIYRFAERILEEDKNSRSITIIDTDDRKNMRSYY